MCVTDPVITKYTHIVAKTAKQTVQDCTLSVLLGNTTVKCKKIMYKILLLIIPPAVIFCISY